MNDKNTIEMASPKVLLLIPSVAKTGVEGEVERNVHPTMDYYALQAATNGTIADYSTIEGCSHFLVALARRAGKDAALAAYGFIKRKEFDAIYSNGENVSIPLSAFLLFSFRRPVHVLIGHHLSPNKKKFFLKWLQSKMDLTFVYAKTQEEYAATVLEIPREKLSLIPFHADARFYAPMERSGGTTEYICSAGLEWRDYPTLMEAIDEMPVELRLAAASPWSKHKNETENRKLPVNVTARRYSYRELRELYANALFVVVPLYDNDFQAGVTTLLEAMSMGKAVIVTRTVGQKDVVIDGETGIYVSPGNVVELRAAIQRLIDNPDEASRLGLNARKAIVDRMSLDHWSETIANTIKELCLRKNNNTGH